MTAMKLEFGNFDDFLFNPIFTDNHWEIITAQLIFALFNQEFIPSSDLYFTLIINLNRNRKMRKLLIKIDCFFFHH